MAMAQAAFLTKRLSVSEEAPSQPHLPLPSLSREKTQKSPSIFSFLPNRAYHAMVIIKPIAIKSRPEL
ncbi:hypothetical protein GBA52_014338 [Prunus armeniaca]|nr:hypothetical protein GBA52_014338 [Prunus armeniaca]